MMDLMLQLMFLFLVFLTVTLIYTKLVARYKVPGGFNDSMSFYMWRRKQVKQDIKDNSVKQVKRHLFRRKVNNIDCQISDKVKEVAENLEQKSKRVVKNINENKLSKIKKDVKRVKKQLGKLETELVNKDKKPISTRQKMISQLKEVYQDE